MSTPPPSSPESEESPPPAGKLLGVGVGAGLLGAAMFGLRYLIRPPTTARVPESISPPLFATLAFQSSHGQMVYHESGTGPALVFIHDVGVGASSYQWSKIYSAFAATHRVLAPDLIGFGESERPRAQLTAADYAASFAEFIQALCGDDVQRPVVIASGLGAGFAALLAVQHPELLGRLILWMPFGACWMAWWYKVASRIPTLKRFVYRNVLARRGKIRARFARQSSIEPAAVDSEAVEVHALCAQQYQAEYAIYPWLQGRLNLDLEGKLAALAVPVTLLWPERAHRLASARAARLQKTNRLCTLRIITGVGPRAPLDAPPLMIEALRDELQAELRILKAS